MPLNWVKAGTALLGATGLLPGGSSGKATKVYNPKNLSAADTGWMNAFNAQQGITSDVNAVTAPMYRETLNRSNAINYSPYLEGSAQAGQDYTNLGSSAMGQMDVYNAGAQLAGQQQGRLYDTGNQIWQSAQDPQRALYDRTAQQFTDQIRSGQAARGLGNSAIGASEEAQTLGNFNIDWQNQQLKRQIEASQAQNLASTAGGRQAELQAVDMNAALGTGAQGIGYNMQGYQTPISGQQYVATQPGQAAQTYAGQMGGNISNYAGIQTQAIPYMNAGQGAQQFNYNRGVEQNAANMNLLTQGAGALIDSYNTPGSWLGKIGGKIFGSGSGADGSHAGDYSGAQMDAWLGDR